MNNKIKNIEKIESKLQKSYNDLKLLKSLNNFVSKKNNIKNENHIYDDLTKDLKDIQNIFKSF